MLEDFWGEVHDELLIWGQSDTVRQKQKGETKMKREKAKEYNGQVVPLDKQAIVLTEADFQRSFAVEEIGTRVERIV